MAEQYWNLFVRMGVPATPVYLYMFLAGTRVETGTLNIAVLAENFVERLFKKSLRRGRVQPILEIGFPNKRKSSRE
jgi:hypothetical protein